MIRYRAWLAALVVSTCVSAQAPPDPVTKIRDYRQRHEAEIVRDLAALLSLPNVAHNNEEGHADIQRNAEAIEQSLKQRGLRTEILNVEGGFPAVYGELLTPGATKTVVFYAHYDGQPVIPARWSSPPFTPTLRDGVLGQGARDIDLATLSSPLPPGSGEWRLYARSASDDKAPIIGFLTALDAMKEAGVPPSVNLKFFLEGEEEAGSDHMGAMLTKYAELLKADLFLLCDGPTHQSGRIQLVYGARGTMGLEMTVYGPDRGLHSGHYGNWAPNPAAELVNLLASMRDEEGHIRIKGFYSIVDPPSAAELRALEQVPDVDEELRKTFALSRTEGKGMKLNRAILDPAMNIRGVRAGGVGSETTNSIMPEATASIDFRLVPRQTTEAVRQLVEWLLKEMGYFIVSAPPDRETRRKHARIIRLDWQMGYPAARTALDSAPARAVAAVMGAAIGGPVLRMPTLGGSVPMYVFEQKLKTPVLILPIANFDNNQHSHNENIRLKNLWDGIEIYGTLFAELGKQWQ
ncbi:MAG: M20/M25/M40 family metallo-hydrolase [Acidobacteriales bacterium]|nr:M20/M25/M40 family metallo-hydrolase [Terriglobales bacterium]